MMTRFWWKFAASICILSMLASCSAAQTTQVDREPLRVEFTQWWGDYTLIIAQERGLFEKYGVNVEPVYYKAYYKSLPDLASGQIDGALLNVGDVLNVSVHTDVIIPAAYDDGGPNTIVVTPSIKSIYDLKGKKLGVPLGSSGEFFVTQMLQVGGLKPSDVSILDYDPSEVPDALGKEIDAGLTWEPYTSISEQKGNHVLVNSVVGTMLYPSVIVFRKDVVESRPEDIRAFLKAWFEAVRFRQQNPQAARQIIANYLGVPLSGVELASSVKLLGQADNQTLFATGLNGRASTLQNIASLNVNFLVRIGTLTQRPDLTLMFDGRYLR